MPRPLCFEAPPQELPKINENEDPQRGEKNMEFWVGEGKKERNLGGPAEGRSSKAGRAERQSDKNANFYPCPKRKMGK